VICINCPAILGEKVVYDLGLLFARESAVQSLRKKECRELMKLFRMVIEVLDEDSYRLIVCNLCWNAKAQWISFALVLVIHFKHQMTRDDAVHKPGAKSRLPSVLGID
jgi:hypothetical protein